MNAFVLVNVVCLFSTGLVYCTPTMVTQASECSTQESYSATSSSYTATSSSSGSSINTSLFQQAFAAAAINSAEADLYLQYLAQLPSNQIQLFEQVISFYSSTTFDIADMVVDFNTFSTEISTLYQTFASQSLYAAGTDWATQVAIMQQAQSSLSNILSYTTQGSCLYELISYANQNVMYAPLAAGILNYLSTLQGQYYTKSTSTTTSSASSYSSTSATTSGISTTSSSINTSLFQQAFTAAAINSAEADLYLQYLAQLPSNQIQLFEKVISYYSSTTFDIADMVVDFNTFSTEISTLYQTFASQSLYAAGTDWATQVAIMQQAQSSLSNILSYTTQGSCLYELISYANQNVMYAPLAAGILNYLSTLQGQYYTKSTSTTTSSASSFSSTSATTSGVSTTSSSINTSLFQQAFTAAAINSAEADLYLQYLAQLPSNQIQLFEKVISFYSSTTFDIADFVVDFNSFSTEISTLYQTFASQSLYAAGTDWATQVAIMQQAQASWSNILSYTTQGSCLYELISYANQNVMYSPLAAGILNYLATLQGQYYTASSSTTVMETSSQSSSSSAMYASSSSSGSGILVA